MKNILYITLITTLFLYSCTSLKKEAKNEKIIYVVPNSVQNWFSDVIRTPNLINKDNVYFIISSMERNNKKVYKLRLCDLESHVSKDKYLIENTNRYLYINEKLYPLLNDLDEIFSVRECCNENLLTGLKNKKYPLSYTVNYEKTYWVIFNNKWGDIIETSDEAKGGYRTDSPNNLK